MSWLINPQRSCLLVLNPQHRLLTQVDSARELVGNVATLLRAARALQLPVLAFERDAEENGPIVDEVAEALPEGAVVGGTQFSAYAHPSVRAWFLANGRDQVVVCGIETHVAVLHTAFGLIDDEYRSAIAADATGAHGGSQHALALARLRDGGAAIVTTEMVVHEWVGSVGSPSSHPLLRELLR